MAGLVRYFTGKPCPKGHIAERFTKYGQCVACAALSGAVWYENNKERAAAKNADWMRNNRPAKRIINSRWRAAHKEQAKAATAAHYAAHPERYAQQRIRFAAAHPEKRKGYNAAWKRAHPAKVSADTRRRQAGKLKATPKWANTFFIEEAYDLAARRTKATGFKWNVDHIVPLRSKLVCGLHVEFNLQVIPAIHNIIKGNRVWPDMPGEQHV